MYVSGDQGLYGFWRQFPDPWRRFDNVGGSDIVWEKVAEDEWIIVRCCVPVIGGISAFCVAGVSCDRLPLNAADWTDFPGLTKNTPETFNFSTQRMSRILLLC